MAYKKKIFDIIPPKEIKEPIVEPQTEGKLSLVEKLGVPPQKPILRPPPSRFKKILIFVGIGLVLVGILAFVFIKPKAEITIWPIKEPVDFKTKASVNISPEGEVIPGEVLKSEKSVSQEFSATGTKLKTAKVPAYLKSECVS